MPSSIDTQQLKLSIHRILSGQADNQEFLQLLEPAITSATVLDPGSQQSLSLLMDDIEQRGRLNDLLVSISRDAGAPKIVVDDSGNIIGANSSARRLADSGAKDLSLYGVSRSEFNKFRSRVATLGGSSLIRISGHREGSLPLVLSGKYVLHSEYILLESLELKWSEATESALQDIFELTSAERAVLLCLARGMQATEISEHRASQVSTVRQQIKSILQKTGCSSQTQVAALAAALGDPRNSPLTVVSAKQKHRQSGYLYREGRRVGWRRYGNVQGRKVLLMHSAYFGVANFEPEIQAAVSADFDVVVVERPGFGLTDEPTMRDTTLLTHMGDCQHVLAELGISPSCLLSHDYGFVYALAFTELPSVKITNLLAVSPVPRFNQDAEFKDIPIQQRAFIWAARHSFWLIRSLLRLGQVKARRLGPERWMEMVFEGADDELDIFTSESGRKVASESFHFNLGQNSRGHELDLQVCISSDWSSSLKHSPADLHLLTGDDNKTFSLAQVKELMTLRPDISLTVLPAGLTLSLRYPEESYRLLKKSSR